MKKSLLNLLAVLFIGSASAQTNIYHEFPDSNAIWNIVAQGCCMFDCPGPPTPNPILEDYTFSYSIGGDTVINNITYHKMIKSGSIHQHCAYSNYVNSWNYFSYYVGAIRQDTALRKVYFANPSTTSEIVFYDFSANVGDTLSMFDMCTVVTSIDSILIGNNYRKRFNFGSSGYSAIEGIGTTTGFFEPVCPFEYFGTLVCFAQDGHTLYPDTTTNCNLITSTPEKKVLSSGLELVPNPFSSQAILTADHVMHNGILIVINSMGQATVQTTDINGTSFSFDASTLAVGIYLLQLVENGEVVGMTRAVITR